MRYFLAMWCCEGFKCIQDITKFNPDTWNQQNLINLLKDQKQEKNPLGHQLFMMKMRAQTNSQRHYEIYAFSAVDGVEEDDLWEWAERDPQSLVNWIRENGVCEYNGKREVRQPMIV